MPPRSQYREKSSMDENISLSHTHTHKQTAPETHDKGSKGPKINHSVCTSIEIKCIKQRVMVPTLKLTMHTGVTVIAGI